MKNTYTSKVPIILDTDLSCDDCVVLPLLLNNPALDLKAITISATGECHAISGYNTLKKLLKFWNINVPCAVGSEKPTYANCEFPNFIRSCVDSFYNVLVKEKFFSPSFILEANIPSAVSLLYNTLTNSSEPVTLLCVASLTNIAELISLYPDIKCKIKCIYQMGGAINVEGNMLIPGFNDNPVNNKAEWNIFVDALAAKKVFDSDIPLVLCPLDVTNYTPLKSGFVEQMKDYPNYKSSKLLQICYLSLADVLIRQHGDSTLCVWDVVPTLLLGKSIESIDWIDFKDAKVVVSADINSPDTYGMTRLSDDISKPTSISKVAVDMDADVFHKLFKEALLAL